MRCLNNSVEYVDSGRGLSRSGGMRCDVMRSNAKYFVRRQSVTQVAWLRLLGYRQEENGSVCRSGPSLSDETQSLWSSV